MSDSVLRLADQIYSPFGPRETRRLRNYVSDVGELVASAFFQPGEQKLTLSAKMGGPLLSTLVYPGEEAVRAVVGLFRQLYNHHEPTSYDQIIKLLSRHAHERGSQHRDVAVAELKALREWEKDALRPTIALKWQHAQPDGSIAHEEDLTPEVLIDLFLHGKYLHKGNDKSDKLDAWPLAHVAQQCFFGAMTALAEVYCVGRNVVAEVPRGADAAQHRASGLNKRNVADAHPGRRSAHGRSFAPLRNLRLRSIRSADPTLGHGGEWPQPLGVELDAEREHVEHTAAAAIAYQVATDQIKGVEPFGRGGIAGPPTAELP